MNYHGRARVSTRSPQAFAICDRCGFLYNHVTLGWQFDWAGRDLINKRILVCPSCMDAPQEQLRSQVIPADPLPIQNPRIQDYAGSSSDYRATSGQNAVDPVTNIQIIQGDVRVTQADAPRVTQETGEPPGGLNQTPGTDPNAPGNDDPGLPYGFDEVPKTGPLT